MSPPWMPFYVADYLADTGHLSAAEHGAYLLLIMHYWQKGGLPSDDRQLARIARMSEDEFSNAKAMLSEFFDQEWRHDRIEAELAKAEEKNAKRVEAGRRGGLAKGRQKPSNATSNAQASSSQPCSSLRSEPKSSLRSDSSSAEPDDGGVIVLEKAKRHRPDDVGTIQDFAEAWNVEASSLGLPIIRDLPPARVSACRARIKDFPAYGFDDPVEGFRSLLSRIRGSPHLRGQNDRGWRANFDWVLNPNNFAKVMDGVYEAQGRKSAFA